MALQRSGGGGRLRTPSSHICDFVPATRSASTSSNYQLNRRLIIAMADLPAGRGIRFGVVSLPNPPICLDVVRNISRRIRRSTRSVLSDDLSRLASAHGASFLGLQGTFADAYARDHVPLNWRNIGHWNYAGHRLVAFTLAWLAEQDAGRVPNGVTIESAAAFACRSRKPPDR